MISRSFQHLRRVLFSFLALAFVSVSMTAYAADKISSDDFKKQIDTRLSMQYVKTKTDKKLKDKELAVYKVLDVQQSAGESIRPESGDTVELVFPKGTAPSKKADKGLPWAELKSDGMILLHMPKQFLRKRGKSSAQTFWRIDNDDNNFAFIKP